MIKKEEKKINPILDNLSLLIPLSIGLLVVYCFVMYWGYSSAVANEYLTIDYLKCGKTVNAKDYADNTYKIKLYFNLYGDCIKNNHIKYGQTYR